MQPAAPAKGLLEQATELATAFGLQPADLLKRFVGGETGAPVKSRMSGTMEFLTEIVPQIINAPIMSALAQKLTQPPMAPVPPQVINNPPQPQAPGQQQPNPQQDLFRFVNEHITGPMIEHLNTGNSGTDFAEWVYGGFPQEQLEALQHVEHPSLPGMKGAPVIIELYKRAGNVWTQQLQSREAQFVKFVEEFCAWRPPEVDDAEAASADEGKVIDLDTKGNDA